MALRTETLKYVDLSINCLTNPEIFDEDVISQSITSILSTTYGERVRLSPFGSDLPNQVFENLQFGGEQLVTSVINSLKAWEDRIQIIESEVSFSYNPNANTLRIIIPYVILNSGNFVVYDKMVSF